MRKVAINAAGLGARKEATSWTTWLGRSGYVESFQWNLHAGIPIQLGRSWRQLPSQPSEKSYVCAGGMRPIYIYMVWGG